MAFCCAGFVLYAQQPGCHLSLSGTVTDEHDRSALSFAEIFLPELGVGAVADEDGYYTVNNLCPGNWLVRVTHLGCEPIEQRISLQKAMTVDVELEHHAEELREMEIIRERPDENVGQARTELDAANIERSSGRDVATMLGVIPGVNVVRTGPTIAKPMIHGLYGNRILLLNQGIRQEDQQWGTEHAPNIDPFTTDRLTVVKGAAAVQYGSDAMGGVVISEPVVLPRNAGTSGEIRLTGSTNGLGGGIAGMLQGGVKGVRGLGWRVQGSSRVLGDLHAANYVLSNTGLREAAGSATLGWQRRRHGATLYYSVFSREMGILRAAHIGNLTDLREAIERQEPWYVAPFSYDIQPPRQVVMHHLLKAEYAYRLTDRDQLVFTYGYQANDRQEYDRRRGGQSSRAALDLFMPTHSGDLVYKHWFGKRLHGKMGVNGNYQENINIPGTGITPLIPNFIRSTMGVFVLEHYPLTEDLELEAGARLEHARLQVYKYDDDGLWITPEHNFTNNALSAGANWALSELVRLRFNISTAYRPPHVSELYSEGVHHGSGSIEVGDATLGNERSLKMVADLEAGLFGGRLATALTVYQDRISNFIYLRPSGFRLTIRGAFPVFDHVATDALLNGVDAMAELKLDENWSIRARFSMVRGSDLSLGGPLFMMPSDRWENALIYRRKSTGKWSDMELEVSSLNVFRQTRFPADIDFAPPPAGYHFLGCMASIARPMGKNELRLGISGSNLLNVAYRDILDRFRYYADARGADVTLWVRYGFGRNRN